MTKSLLILHKAKPTGGSDLALKRGVTPIQNALEIIRALNPVTWYWKATKGGKKLQHGFIAQDVEKILPELVEDGVWVDGTTRKFLATDSILPYLVSALKEQQTHIAKLQKTIEDLQKKL